MSIFRRRRGQPHSSEPLLLLGPFRQDGGLCVTTELPRELIDSPEFASWDAPGWEILDDGVPLTIVTKDHDEIRRRGRGRYCFWGEAIYLSAIDGSLPGDNGHTYCLRRRIGDGGSPVAGEPNRDATGAMAVPGMISQEECDLLDQMAAKIDLGTCRIVEFGPFFGRSTTALAHGAAMNPSLDRTSGKRPILSVDRFAWPVADAHVIGDVGAFVRSFADEAGCGALIHLEDGRVIFREAFDYFVDPTGLVETLQIDFRAMPPVEDDIGLLFLDGPKTVGEFRSVFSAVGDTLVPGARVLFQDFFVHTSGQLAGCVSALIEAGFLVPTTAAGSTLACEWRPCPAMQWRDACPLNTQGLADRIAWVRPRVQDVCCENDPTYFLARLHLAEAQLRFAEGDGQGAATTLKVMRDEYGMRPETWADLTDLIGVSFQPIDPSPVFPKP